MNITTSLELSRKLYELGVRMDTYFIWLEIVEEPKHQEVIYYKDKPFPHESRRLYPAPTAEEIGALLPNGVWKIKHRVGALAIEDKSLTNTMAKILIYLIEQGIISVESVNGIIKIKKSILAS